MVFEAERAVARAIDRKAGWLVDDDCLAIEEQDFICEQFPPLPLRGAACQSKGR